MIWIPIVYFAIAIPVGLFATWQNRGLFRNSRHRYLRALLHVLVIGAFWPITARMAISFRPRF